MERINDFMQQALVDQPFDRKACPLLEGLPGESNDEVLPFNCEKEVIDLGACPDEVSFFGRIVPTVEDGDNPK